MKKNLQQKLKAYSMAAGAVVAVGSAANAQVVYTDVSPDATVATDPDSVTIDLNNDAIVDFTLYKTTGTAEAVRMHPAPGNEVLGTTSYGQFFLASVLNAGDLINGTATMWNGTMNGSMMTLVWGNYGYWAGMSDKYLGLRFVVGGDTHYAWARLTVAGDASSGTLKDFAYESTPGTGIQAGNGVSVPEVTESETNIFPNPSQGQVTLEIEADYQMMIMDYTGRVVMDQEVEAGTHQINLSDQPAGVYIVRLMNDNESIEKRLIIQ